MAIGDGGLFVPQTTLAPTTTTSGSDTDTYTQEFTTPAGVTAASFFVNKTADTGTATLDVFLQARSPQSYGGTAAYVDVTVGIVPQFADGVTTLRIGQVGPTLSGGDSDGITVLVAAGAAAGSHAVESYMPQRWRLRIRCGGTTVTCTQSISHVYHPHV